MKEWCNFYNLHNINYSNLNSKSLEEKRKKGLIFQYEKDAHLIRVFINITYKIWQMNICRNHRNPTKLLKVKLHINFGKKDTCTYSIRIQVIPHLTIVQTYIWNNLFFN